MKRIVLLLLTLVATVSTLTESAAPPPDGNMLLKRCPLALRYLDGELKHTDAAEGIEMGWCLGYVNAARTSTELCRYHVEAAQRAGMECRFASKDGSNGEPLDVPDLLGEVATGCIADIPSQQSVRIVVKYLRDNPEYFHHSAARLVWMALRDAFPCPDEKAD